MVDIGPFALTLRDVSSIALRVVLNPFVLAGLGCFAASVVLWLIVLSRVDVSFAYPFVSLGIVITTLFGHWAFDEQLSFQRTAGIVVICVGVVLISRTGAPA